MNGDCQTSSRKKIIVSVIVAICGILALVAAYLFAPDPMPVDWDKVEYIPSNVTLLATDDERNPTDAVALVRYAQDGAIDASDWKVLQFTDMHLTQEHERNTVSLNLFIDTLKREKPDFVALTGDIITRPLGRARAVQLAEIFEKMNIYWCACLGNHEGDSAPFTLTRSENIRIWSKYPHCLVEDDVKKTEAGDAVWGLGNTVINLLGADYTVTQSLIFMDSGDRIRNSGDKESQEFAQNQGIDKNSYDFLKESQMTWYKEQVMKVTNGLTNGVKTMLFIHIPLVEMSNVRLIKTRDPLPEGWYYADPEHPLMVGDEIYGYMTLKEGWNLAGDCASYEKCYCSDYNSGMYDLMKSMRAGVNALFCGHDHISNSLLYEDAPAGETPVYLCYGVCSGLQSYNLYQEGLSDTNDYSLRGYASIEIHSDSSFDLYHIRYTDVAERMLQISHSEPRD